MDPRKRNSEQYQQGAVGMVVQSSHCVIRKAQQPNSKLAQMKKTTLRITLERCGKKPQC